MEMLNIMDLFEEVEINNNKKLSENDIEFCNMQENIYIKCYESFNAFGNVIQELKDINIKELNNKYNYNSGKFNYTYSNATNYTPNIKDGLININKRFIDGITGYFEHTYDLKIENSPIEEKIKDRFTNYNDIIELILEQLDGMSFKERGDQQKIEEIQKHTKYSKPKVKNKIITMNSFFGFKQWGNDMEISYSYEDKLHALYSAINSFDNVDFEINWQSVKKFIDREFKDNTKITGVKMFKNGRIDIIFTSYNFALEFARKYLNYME